MSTKRSVVPLSSYEYPSTAQCYHVVERRGGKHAQDERGGSACTSESRDSYRIHVNNNNNNERLYSFNQSITLTTINNSLTNTEASTTMSSSEDQSGSAEPSSSTSFARYVINPHLADKRHWSLTISGVSGTGSGAVQPMRLRSRR